MSSNARSGGPLPTKRDWHVLQTLAPSTAVHVELDSGAWVSGSVAAVDDDSLTVLRDNGPVRLPRSSVVFVGRYADRHHSALVGAIIGAVVFGASAAICYSAGEDTAAHCDRLLVAVPLATGGFALLGAAVPHLITVYEPR